MAANLPKLPGFNSDNTVKQNFHLPHSLNIRNGYRIPESRPATGIGRQPLDDTSVRFNDLRSDSYLFDPKLTYGILKKPTPKPFTPDFVRFDKVCLTFFATFFLPAEFPEDTHRANRRVRIVYFLEDDTITVLENSSEVRAIYCIKFNLNGFFISRKSDSVLAE